jgi:hypothetical protein
MKRVLLMGAAVAAFGLGLTIAQAGPRMAHVAAGAPEAAPSGKNDVSSARKSKKKKAKSARATVRPDAGVRSGRDTRAIGDDRREESGSGM